MFALNFIFFGSCFRLLESRLCGSSDEVHG